jgi:O-antigen ligase
MYFYNENMQLFIFGIVSLIFVLAPLVFSPPSSELFEFPKMLIIYFFSGLLLPFVLFKFNFLIFNEKAKGIASRFSQFASPFLKNKLLFLSLVLFISSQLISTVFSIDKHVSIFGYYSRFQGGLFSLSAYLIIFLTIVLYFKKKDVNNLLIISLFTAFVIALFGLPSHFGKDFICLIVKGKFNTSCWSADFIPEERIFATLGQPNWFAAYLLINTLIVLYFLLKNNTFNKKILQKIFSYFLIFLFLIFSLELLWTKSDSALIAYTILIPIPLLSLFLKAKNKNLINAKTVQLLIIAGLYLSIAFTFLKPQTKIFITNIKNSNLATQTTTEKLVESTAAKTYNVSEDTITPSSTIRLIVWRGAVALGLNKPLFGTGPETFAYSYYQTRPNEHNLTSEWNFVYNKAHNELLNYFANTGFLGLATYLLMFISFILPALLLLIKRVAQQSNSTKNLDNRMVQNQFSLIYIIIMLAIFTINFFGFSTSVTALFFFSFPALFVVIKKNEEIDKETIIVPTLNFKNLIGYFLIVVFCVVYIMNYYTADYFFARSKEYRQMEKVPEAYHLTQKAIKLRNEPSYVDQQAYLSAHLSLIFKIEADNLKPSESLNADNLAMQAIKLNQQTIQNSPENPQYYKTQSKIYYLLSLGNMNSPKLSTKYTNKADNALVIAGQLAPTDPLIPFNRASLYLESDKEKARELLEQTLLLKPNYTEALNLLESL